MATKLRELPGAKLARALGLGEQRVTAIQVRVCDVIHVTAEHVCDGTQEADLAQALSEMVVLSKEEYESLKRAAGNWKILKVEE